MEDRPPASQEGVREEAIQRIRKKREFKAHALAYVLVNALLVGIWASTGGGFFWPVFPILGWGIGIAFHGLDAYGQQRITEEQIRREIERMP